MRFFYGTKATCPARGEVYFLEILSYFITLIYSQVLFKISSSPNGQIIFIINKHIRSELASAGAPARTCWRGRATAPTTRALGNTFFIF